MTNDLIQINCVVSSSVVLSLLLTSIWTLFSLFVETHFARAMHRCQGACQHISLLSFPPSSMVAFGSVESSSKSQLDAIRSVNYGTLSFCESKIGMNGGTHFAWRMSLKHFPHDDFYFSKTYSSIKAAQLATNDSSKERQLSASGQSATTNHCHCGVRILMPGWREGSAPTLCVPNGCCPLPASCSCPCSNTLHPSGVLLWVPLPRFATLLSLPLGWAFEGQAFLSEDSQFNFIKCKCMPKDFCPLCSANGFTCIRRWIKGSLQISAGNYACPGGLGSTNVQEPPDRPQRRPNISFHIS